MSFTYNKGSRISESLRGKRVRIKVVIVDEEETDLRIKHIDVCEDISLLAIDVHRNGIFIGETEAHIPHTYKGPVLNEDYFHDYVRAYAQIREL